MPATTKTMQPQFRHFEVRGVNAEERTIDLSFSSEEPYERWWGVEILDHSGTSMKTSRMERSAPLLLDHDMTKQIGVVERVWIEERIGRASVRFSRSALGEEVFNDVSDGIRRNVSVGYQINAMTLESKEGDVETYRVTDWAPFEISIVSVPADTSVGVGRSADGSGSEVLITSAIKEKEGVVENTENVEVVPVAENTPVEEVKAMGKTDEINEDTRAQEILSIGKRFGMVDEAIEAVGSSVSVENFRVKVMEKMENKKPVDTRASEIGMSKEEVKQYSFIKAINALANPSDKRAQEAAAFEFEASRAAAEKMGRTARGLMIPIDVLKRDLEVMTTNGSTGGKLVENSLLSGSFIDMLRNRALMMQIGTVMTGLTGNVAIPRQTGAATAYWLDESGAATESAPALDQMALSPKTVAAYTDISRRMLLQSSIDVEMFVRSDLASVLALAIDAAAIAGTGANGQPTGILNTSGIGLVALGTDGAAPTWASQIALESAVAASNADIGSLKYITNAKGRGKLKTVEKATGTAQFLWGEGNMINGYEVLATNQIPSNLTKGTGTNLSAEIFGNFSDLIIGLWGSLDINVDPYSLGTSGAVRVTAFQDCDIGLRHAASFAAIKDMVTA